MKLYKFILTMGNETPELLVTSFEVEEKVKCYVGAYRRFMKTEIGVPTGRLENEVILLENNPVMASKILIQAYRKKLEKAISEVDRIQNSLSFLEQLN